MAPAIGALSCGGQACSRAGCGSSTLQSGQPRRNSLPTRCPMVAADLDLARAFTAERQPEPIRQNPLSELHPLRCEWRLQQVPRSGPPRHMGMPLPDACGQ